MKEGSHILRSLIASGGLGELVLKWIEYAALAIEVLAVLVIIGAISYGMARFTMDSILRPGIQNGYQQLKGRLGRALLLGLARFSGQCALFRRLVRLVRACGS